MTLKPPANERSGKHVVDPELRDARHHEADDVRDAELEEDVVRLLSESGDVDASEITVTATGNHVRLEGPASNHKEKERMLEIARSVSGATDVIDSISVGDENLDESPL